MVKALRSVGRSRQDLGGPASVQANRRVVASIQGFGLRVEVDRAGPDEGVDLLRLDKERDRRGSHGLLMEIGQAVLRHVEGDDIVRAFGVGL